MKKNEDITACPVCFTNIIYKNKAKVVRCPNPDCGVDEFNTKYFWIDGL
jgi:NAD-dependent DNA ligase